MTGTTIHNKPAHETLTKTKQFNFRFPASQKLKTRVICAKRDVTITKFIEEAIKNHIKLYNHLLEG